jgi:hypothetical protein
LLSIVALGNREKIKITNNLELRSPPQPQPPPPTLSVQSKNGNGRKFILTFLTLQIKKAKNSSCSAYFSANAKLKLD